MLFSHIFVLLDLTSVVLVLTMLGLVLVDLIAHVRFGKSSSASI